MAVCLITFLPKVGVFSACCLDQSVQGVVGVARDGVDLLVVVKNAFPGFVLDLGDVALGIVGVVEVLQGFSAGALGVEAAAVDAG